MCAQQTVRVLGQASCAQCRIEVSRHMLLQTADSAAELDRQPYSMAMDSEGRVLVAIDGSDHVKLFKGDGSFAARVGRRGRGPGEFISANHVSFGPGDTAFAFDSRNSRVSVFSPAMTFVRSAPIPRMFSGTVLKDGSILISGVVPDPSRIGKAFHLFDRVGNQLQSFGFSDASVVPGRGGLAVNWVAPSRDGGFWSVSYRGAYTLAKWTQDGKLVQRLDISSALVGPGMGDHVGFTPDRATDAYVRSIVEDGEGRVWVEIVAADKDWKRGARFNRDLPGERGMIPDISDYDRVYDTVIEVFDPRSGARIVSQRFDAHYALLLAPSRIGRPIVQPDGTFRMEVHSLRLIGLPER